MTTPATLVVDLFPALLQPEGDHGNAVMIADRIRRLGGQAQVLTVQPGETVPTADLYLVAGSEDQDLVACSGALRRCVPLQRAVERGAAVLGVGAGFTALCREFVDAAGASHRGLGLLDVHMRWAQRADGPVITKPNPELGLPPLSGYEFHHGRAHRGPDAAPVAALEVGIGDGREDGPFDGAVTGRVLGSWIHGPLLPRNPEVADLLLGWVRPDLLAGRAAGHGLDDTLAAKVRAGRIAEARSGP